MTPSPALVDDLRARGRVLRAESRAVAAPACSTCATPLLAYAKASWYVARAGAARRRRRARVLRPLLGHAAACLALRARARHRHRLLRRARAAHRHAARRSAPSARRRRRASRATVASRRVRVPDLVAPWFDAAAMPFATRHEPFAGELTLDELYPADVGCVPPGRPRDWSSSLRRMSALLRGDDEACDRMVRARARDGEARAAERGGARTRSAGARVTGRSAAARRPGAAARAGGPRGDPGGQAIVERLPTGARDVATPERRRRRHRPRPLHPIAAERDDRAGRRAPRRVRRAGRRRRRSAPSSTTSATGTCPPRASACSTATPAALRTLRDCLVTLAQLLAPFVPFVADEIYERLDGSEPSVHLSDWPVAGASRPRARGRDRPRAPRPDRPPLRRPARRARARAP